MEDFTRFLKPYPEIRPFAESLAETGLYHMPPGACYTQQTSRWSHTSLALATARLRRTFLERRQAEINAEDALLRQRQLMKDKKEQLDRACVLYDQRLVHNLPVQQERKDEIRNTALQKEVIKW
ncbi:uncharacterized protein LOC127877017 [Dreissena polymorpha]|uniref:uncharacterized protein LOC127877017 n=1 Tax=Dreissena polymorpha TaxID=45954 RepID=UPI0022641D17|nr:uncharacterized protein LOC127877017 [Dreissena polymorpha]